MNTRDLLDRLRNDPQAMEDIAANASAQQMMVLLRALLAECRPYVEYEREARERELMFAGGIVSVVSRATHERDACDSLLARIDATLKERGEYRYWPYEPRTVGALPAPQLTEADVRRIVREELARTPPQGHGEKQT